MTATDYLFHVAKDYGCQTFEEEVAVVKTAPSVKDCIDEFWCDFWKRIAEFYGGKND